MSHFTEYKTTLVAQLETVTQELTSIATHNEHTGDWVAVPEERSVGSADENIAADAAEEWGNRRALMTQLETRYKNIQRALKKIADGTYGLCEICGKPIEQERLTVLPSARTDIAHINEEESLPL